MSLTKSCRSCLKMECAALVAPAAIAQPEDRRGVRITAPADPVPVPAEAVAGEVAGVVDQADVEVGAAARQAVDAVRNDHAGGPTGEVVVEGLERPLGPGTTLAIELPQKFLGLGVDGKHRVFRGG